MRSAHRTRLRWSCRSHHPGVPSLTGRAAAASFPRGRPAPSRSDRRRIPLGRGRQDLRRVRVPAVAGPRLLERRAAEPVGCSGVASRRTTDAAMAARLRAAQQAGALVLDDLADLLEVGGDDRLARPMYSNSFVGEPKKRVPSALGTCGETQTSQAASSPTARSRSTIPVNSTTSSRPRRSTSARPRRTARPSPIRPSGRRADRRAPPRSPAARRHTVPRAEGANEPDRRRSEPARARRATQPAGPAHAPRPAARRRRRWVDEHARARRRRPPARP